MGVVEIYSSDKGKCIGCEFYKYKNKDYWSIGECVNEKTKASKKPRYYNDKICVWFQRKKQ